MELRECLVEASTTPPTLLPPSPSTATLHTALMVAFWQDTHSYLDTIMSAAEGLPLTVQEEILAVVEGRLQAKVRYHQ